MTRVPAEAERNIKSAAEEMHDIFYMISVRLLECLTPIMWKMDVMFAGDGAFQTKDAVLWLCCNTVYNTRKVVN